jgi:hypothetical protein
MDGRLWVSWIRYAHPATLRPGPWVKASVEVGLPSRRLARDVARSAVPSESEDRADVLVLPLGETPELRSRTL